MHFLKLQTNILYLIVSAYITKILWIFVTKVCHSRQFILFSDHRMNISNYKIALQKIVCLN